MQPGFYLQEIKANKFEDKIIPSNSAPKSPNKINTEPYIQKITANNFLKGKQNNSLNLIMQIENTQINITSKIEFIMPLII